MLSKLFRVTQPKYNRLLLNKLLNQSKKLTKISIKNEAFLTNAYNDLINHYKCATQLQF
jgi:hypothetical protein